MLIHLLQANRLKRINTCTSHKCSICLFMRAWAIALGSSVSHDFCRRVVGVGVGETGAMFNVLLLVTSVVVVGVAPDVVVHAALQLVVMDVDTAVTAFEALVVVVAVVTRTGSIMLLLFKEAVWQVSGGGIADGIIGCCGDVACKYSKQSTYMLFYSGFLV
jgi:hypothetical protein